MPNYNLSKANSSPIGGHTLTNRSNDIASRYGIFTNLREQAHGV